MSRVLSRWSAIARSGPRRRRLAVVLAALAALAIASRVWRTQGPEQTAARAARSAFAAGRYGDAGRAVSEWCRYAPRARAARLLKVRVALARNASTAAVDEAFETARAVGCTEDELKLVRALADVKLKRYAEAEAVLRQAFEAQRGPDPQVDEALARLYIESFDIRRAAIVLDRWARDAPNDPRPHLWRVEVDRRNGSRPDAIIRDYREVLARDPNSPPARLGLADALRAQHRPEEARTEYAAYLRLKPEDADGHFGAGRNARELGDDAAAAAHFERVIALDPARAEAYRERAEVARRQGSAAEALGYLDRAVRLDPFDVEARHARGLTLARLGRREEAAVEQAAARRLRDELRQLDRLKARLIENPNDSDVEAQIARWMFDHGHDAEAARWAEKIVRAHPGHPAANRLLAEFHERHGNPGRANFYRLNAQEAH